MKELRFMKRAEVNKNRIILPKIIIDKFGRDFYLTVNLETGEMILTPIKYSKKKGQ